ncbi:MAG TPA: carboxypeptidase regulatory-like domain-containing protein [Candidatus Eisenbacteria bacterium]|nr:carboxypeptidase regulatory-like domain-containing protein [Candidatus Eisenbacteria bacterium]
MQISVVDEKNQPVSEASVVVTCGGKPVTTVATDAGGKTNLDLPSAGSYQVSIRKPGFLPNETTVEVSANRETLPVDVVLSAVELSQQSVDVKGTADNPVTDDSGMAQSLPTAQAKISPTRPVTLNDALPLIPGIVRGQDGNVKIAGFGEDHSALLVNSVDVTDPATGNFGLSIPIDSIETVQVTVMPYLAQYGKFTAGVVTAETRRGGDKWDFSLNDPFPDWRIRSAHLEGVKDATPRFNASGPIVKDKLYFLEGAEYLLYKYETRTLPYPENQSTSQAINSFTQVDWIINKNQTLTASLHWAPHNLGYVGLNYFDPQPVTPNADFHEDTATIMHRWSLGGGLLQSTLAETSVSSNVSPQSSSQLMVLQPTGNSGNYFSQEARDSSRYEWIENYTVKPLHFAGEHTIQIGSVLGHSENQGQFYARPVLIQNASGQMQQRIDFVGGKPFDLSDTEPAFFVQDHWVLNPHLAIDAGIRYEAQTITSTTRTAPRGGLVWSPDSGKTTIRGGMGIFYDSVPLDIYAFNSYPSQLITTYGPNGLPVGPPIHYINLTDQAVQSKFPFIDRRDKTGNFAPYSVAWNVETERVVNRALTVRLKYLQSWENGTITLQPEVVAGRNAMVLGSGGSAQTRQLEFTSRIGSEAKRQFFFSYVRQYAYGDVSSASQYLGNFPYPVVRSGLVAALPSEIPNRFLLWGTYALPKKFMINPHLELRNGFPWQPTDVLQQWVQTYGPQSRYPRYFSADVAVAKDFTVRQEHAVRLTLTVQNLTDHFNPLQVHSNIGDPLYGQFFGNWDRKYMLDFDFLF